MLNCYVSSRFRRSIASGVPLTCLVTALCGTSLWAQPRAVLLDGSGPWSDAQWAFTVLQFSGLLSDAGYSVKVVSPVNLPGALDSPDILVAVPSLESLPFDCFTAIVTHVNSGGMLIASGGEPFLDPLYLTPDRPLAGLGRLPSGSRGAPAAGFLYSPSDPDGLSVQRAVHDRFRAPCACGA